MKKACQYANTGAWRAKPGEKRILKWLARRARRQAEKRDLENIPQRFTKGYL